MSGTIFEDLSRTETLTARELEQLLLASRRSSREGSRGAPAVLRARHDEWKTTHGHYRCSEDDGRWVETVTGSKEFQFRTNVYDRGDGKLLTRDTVLNDGSKIRGEWRMGLWAETLIRPSDSRPRTNLYDQPGGCLVRRAREHKGHYVVETFGENGLLTRTFYRSEEDYDVEKPGNELWRQRLVVVREADGRETLLERCTVQDDGTYVEEKWSNQPYPYKWVWEKRGATGRKLLEKWTLVTVDYRGPKHGVIIERWEVNDQVAYDQTIYAGVVRVSYHRDYNPGQEHQTLDWYEKTLAVAKDSWGPTISRFNFDGREWSDGANFRLQGYARLDGKSRRP